MTNRERLLAIMDRRSPDRIPWIPRLQVWHTAHSRRGTLPERFAGLSLRGAERLLRMGNPAREGHVYAAQQDGDVEVRQESEGRSTLTFYRTPAGTVTTRQRSSEELDRVGIGSLEIEHMIKGPDDFAVVEYLVTHTRYRATYAEYLDYEAGIGEDGYPMVAAGDCPFHHFLQKLAGYQNAYLLLFDHPDRVEHLLTTMEETERERVWPIVAQSPARLILHGVHFGQAITPPHLFSRYITPYYRDFSQLLHSHGKTLTMHADNDARLILGNIEEAGFDMAETFTTAPQVSCTLQEARSAWGNRVIIWGGVPSVILEPTYSEEAFAAYMRGLFRTIAPGDAFILGVADNIMPAALPERLERIAAMVEAWGAYPIDPARVN
ncbi:MAG: uroporphyrinogen decarboxylase family protein [Candidatus Latescibacterota bacterium]